MSCNTISFTSGWWREVSIQTSLLCIHLSFIRFSVSEFTFTKFFEKGRHIFAIFLTVPRTLNELGLVYQLWTNSVYFLFRQRFSKVITILSAFLLFAFAKCFILVVAPVFGFHCLSRGNNKLYFWLYNYILQDLI